MVKNPLLKPPSLKSVLDALPIIDENILAEAAFQPGKFIDASRYRVGRMRWRAYISAKLEALESQLGLAVRARGNADGRVTEGYVKSKVQKNKQVRRLQSKVREAEQLEEFSKLILEAYRQRRDAIRIIADAELREGDKQSGEFERVTANRRLNIEARKVDRQKRRRAV